MAVYGPPSNEELYHYGIKRRSGRYPYGSGENPYQGEPSKQKRKTYGELGTIEKLKLKHKQKAKVKAKEKAEKDAAKKAKEEAKKAEEKKLENEKKPESEKVKTMTDEEIVNAINRLRLEQSYLKLIQENSPASSNQNKSQQPASQQTTQQQSQQQKPVNKGKSWLDKSVDLTKKVGDLSTNLSTIAKGANGVYANVNAIRKAMSAAEEAAKEAAKKKK